MRWWEEERDGGSESERESGKKNKERGRQRDRVTTD